MKFGMKFSLVVMALCLGGIAFAKGMQQDWGAALVFAVLGLLAAGVVVPFLGYRRR